MSQASNGGDVGVDDALDLGGEGGGVVPVREGDLEALAGNAVGEHVTLDHGADVNSAVTALLGIGARSNEGLLLTTPGAEDDGVLELHVVVTAIRRAISKRAEVPLPSSLAPGARAMPEAELRARES